LNDGQLHSQQLLNSVIRAVVHDSIPSIIDARDNELAALGENFSILD
jgi:hypothetical protein